MVRFRSSLVARLKSPPLGLVTVTGSESRRVAYVRTVKTASGAIAVQIVYSSRRGSRSIEHLGSAHDDRELEALKAATSGAHQVLLPPGIPCRSRCHYCQRKRESRGTTDDKETAGYGSTSDKSSDSSFRLRQTECDALRHQYPSGLRTPTQSDAIGPKRHAWHAEGRGSNSISSTKFSGLVF